MEIVSTTTTTDPVNMYNFLNGYMMNPIVFIILLLVIIAYFVFSSSLGSSVSSDSTASNGGTSTLLTGIVVTILVILFMVQALQYFFSINITAYIQGLFSPKTSLDIVVDQSTYQPAPVPEIKFRKQVFNVPGNYYTYDNAKALCKAYGADLATYNQIESAYNNGAEWCNYGWSANQMALFPTQKNTYNNLQKIPGHENDCGRPGINGGYIANPNVKFGVNCYGNKPRITPEEDELMKTEQPYPVNEQDIAFQKKVDKLKKNLDQILVSPFNHNMWSEL
jgi:hypothetical protein